MRFCVLVEPATPADRRSELWKLSCLRARGAALVQRIWEPNLAGGSYENSAHFYVHDTAAHCRLRLEV